MIMVVVEAADATIIFEIVEKRTAAVLRFMYPIVSERTGMS
jgi:hypothetical protein